MRIYARTTEQGTAALETAVCEQHKEMSPVADDARGELVDCTGNDELVCSVCGAHSS